MSPLPIEDNYLSENERANRRARQPAEERTSIAKQIEPTEVKTGLLEDTLLNLFQTLKELQTAVVKIEKFLYNKQEEEPKVDPQESPQEGEKRGPGRPKKEG